MHKNLEIRTQPYPIAFFDADKTLWKVTSSNGNDDWTSKIANPIFELLGKTKVQRKQDGTIFELKEDVTECLQKLSKEGIGIGLISDNRHEDVASIASLLGIWSLFDSKLVNISLWEGPCPKDQMIKDTIEKLNNIKISKALLVDDKDYGGALIKLGYNFILSPKDIFPTKSVLQFFGIMQ